MNKWTGEVCERARSDMIPGVCFVWPGGQQYGGGGKISFGEVLVLKHLWVNPVGISYIGKLNTYVFISYEKDH